MEALLKQSDIFIAYMPISKHMNPILQNDQVESLFPFQFIGVFMAKILEDKAYNLSPKAKHTFK